MTATIGATNDIDVSKLKLKGEGSAEYTLTSSNVEIDSATQFTVILNAVDQRHIEGLLNKDGIQAADGTTAYNLAAAANWNPANTGNADLTGNAVTVSSTQTPTVISATYNASTGVLAVTGTNLVQQSGATNDIDLSKLTLKGQADGTQALSGVVEITDATSFTVTLSGATKTAVDALLNKNGTSSVGGTNYNLAAADNWTAPSRVAILPMRPATVSP